MLNAVTILKGVLLFAQTVMCLKYEKKSCFFVLFCCLLEISHNNFAMGHFLGHVNFHMANKLQRNVLTILWHQTNCAIPTNSCDNTYFGKLDLPRMSQQVIAENPEQVNATCEYIVANQDFPLERILACSIATEYFLYFTNKEFSSENLLALLEIRILLALDKELFFPSCATYFAKYLDDKSVYEVNIPKHVLALYDANRRVCMDKVKTELELNLADPLARFLKSIEFKECLLVCMFDRDLNCNRVCNVCDMIRLLAKCCQEQEQGVESKYHFDTPTK